MTDLIKQAEEMAKEKATSSISQYRTYVFTSMVKLHVEIDNKDFIGLPHEQETQTYDEMNESLKCIDELVKKIKAIEIE